MGCSRSKAEDLPLVIRCRERRELVRAAADHRYALAAAHASYFRSLKDVGDSLRKFVDENLISTSSSSSSSPFSVKSTKSNASESLHLHGDEESHSQLSGCSSDNDAIPQGDFKHPHRSHGGKGFDDGALNFHNREKSSSDYAYYVEKSAPPMKTEVQEAPVEPAYGYSDSKCICPADYSGNYGYFRNYSPARMKNSEGFKLSPQKEALEFFNPFAVFDSGQTGYDPISAYGYGSNSTSPDLSVVREREGIPDLEEEPENEVLKETSARPLSSSELQSEKPLVPLQYQEEIQNSTSFRDLREVVAEIRDDFEIASGYGKEVASMLEIEKLPYRPGFLKVIVSRMLYLIAPLLKLSVSSKLASASMNLSKFYFEDFVKDVNATACNLSSTLDKLFAWEKKLYKEVKDEERLRVKYEKRYKRLRILDKEGAEPGKIHSAQTSIRRLRTKLDVSIKAIDVISSRIHKLRDEELQPHVAALIHGLIRMWKAMLECHQKQFQAIMEIKTRNLRPKTGHQTDTTSSTAIAELENELLSWCHCFKDWIGFQKSYVESLNGWLLKCLQYETEGTLDKCNLPYSPCQLGAPPIFIICNDWQKALESISEGRVAKAVNAFSTIKCKRDAASDKTGLVDDVIDSSSSLGGALVPIFKALESFTCEALRAHELVRL